jgi:hypothetical protein
VGLGAKRVRVFLSDMVVILLTCFTKRKGFLKQKTAYFHILYILQRAAGFVNSARRFAADFSRFRLRKIRLPWHRVQKFD